MPITLAQLVRDSRLRVEGMSQAELAKLVGCSTENITSIENSRNRQPSPEIIARMATVLDLTVEDIYSAIAGTLHKLPWEKSGEMNIKDPELELMFRQLDNLPDGEPKDRVKAFIRFTLDEERKRRRRELDKR